MITIKKKYFLPSTNVIVYFFIVQSFSFSVGFIVFIPLFFFHSRVLSPVYFFLLIIRGWSEREKNKRVE